MTTQEIPFLVGQKVKVKLGECRLPPMAGTYFATRGETVAHPSVFNGLIGTVMSMMDPSIRLWSDSDSQVARMFKTDAEAKAAKSDKIRNYYWKSGHTILVRFEESQLRWSMTIAHDGRSLFADYDWKELRFMAMFLRPDELVPASQQDLVLAGRLFPGAPTSPPKAGT